MHGKAADAFADEFALAGVDTGSDLEPVGRRVWTLENGVMDWSGALAALREDGYEGFISVETHVRPKVEGSRFTLERLRALVAASDRSPVATAT